MSELTGCLIILSLNVVARFRFIPAVSLACILWTTGAHAGPPLLTDDPDTPGPNHWEINAGQMSEYAAHEWVIGAPLADINYGVGEHIQLKYQTQYNELVPHQGGVRAGMGNSLAGVKWRFIDQTNWSCLEVSTYPQLSFVYPGSSPARGLAQSGDNILLPIEVEHQFNPLTVYGEVGYLKNEHQSRGGWYGLAWEYDLTGKFAIEGEFYGVYDRYFQNNGLSFNLGFGQSLTEHVALIGSAGRGIFGPSERAPAFMSYLALRLTF
jgi:hypothetical protein